MMRSKLKWAITEENQETLMEVIEIVAIAEEVVEIEGSDEFVYTYHPKTRMNKNYPRMCESTGRNTDRFKLKHPRHIIHME